MVKKIIIGLAIILGIVITSAITYAVTTAVQNPKTKPSDYKIGIKYEKAIESDKPMLALFYADWCGFCLKFMPQYKIVSSVYKNKFNFVMINVEAPENSELVQNADLSGYPTLYILDPKYDNKVLLNNVIYQDMPKLRTELDRYLRIRKILDSASK